MFLHVVVLVPTFIILVSTYIVLKFRAANKSTSSQAIRIKARADQVELELKNTQLISLRDILIIYIYIYIDLFIYLFLF